MSETEFKTRHVRKRVGRNVFATPPKISVVITACNNAGSIRDTIDSLMAQKYREHEIVVVNDGSPGSDQLERSLKVRLEDIIYIKQRAAGRGAALNTGIEHARGQIVAFVDGGDILLPEFLASQYVFLVRNEYDMVYCNAALIGGQSAYRHSLMESKPSMGEANFDSILDKRCNVITSGMLARKKMIVDVGMFEFDEVPEPDLHLWLRMARIGSRIGYQQKQLVKHHVYPMGVSDDIFGQVERELEVLKRISSTIELNEAQKKRVDRRIAGLEADLAVEQARAFFAKGDFREASVAFRVANRQRRSLKLSALTFLTRFAPRMVLRPFQSNRSDNTATRHP